jgi:hypothetical protein
MGQKSTCHGDEVVTAVVASFVASETRRRVLLRASTIVSEQPEDQGTRPSDMLVHNLCTKLHIHLIDGALPLDQTTRTSDTPVRYL